MASAPILRVECVDVYGKPLNELLDVLLRHQPSGELTKVQINAAGPVGIEGLLGAPDGLYRVDVDPPSYQWISRFMNLESSDTTDLRIVFPIDPQKVRSVKFPNYADVSDELHGLF